MAFESRWPRQAVPDVDSVRAGVVGRVVAGVRRRGKYLVIDLDDAASILIHLRMSGRLEHADGDGPRHVRAIWSFDDGSRLLLCDSRKFARIIFTQDVERVTGALGVEPLARAFTPRALGRLLRARARRLKPLLLDQTVIAGLGNIYTDEALFRAGLHPLRRSNGLRDAEVAALHGAIRGVLRAAVRRRGTSFDWIYPGGRMQERLMVYGRGGEPCRRCAATIEVQRVGQRGTHVCPRCQRLGARIGARRVRERPQIVRRRAARRETAHLSACRSPHEPAGAARTHRGR